MRSTTLGIALAFTLLACGGEPRARGAVDAGEEPADTGEEPADAGDPPEPDADTRDAEGDLDASDVEQDADTRDAQEAGEPDAELRDADADAGDAEPELPPRDLRLSGGFVREVALLSQGALLLMLEAPLHAREQAGHPRRELVWIDTHGQVIRRFTPPAGRELLDSAVHASGAITVLVASDQGYALQRLSAEGKVRAELAIVDGEIAHDPPALPAGSASQPIGDVTHDTGRIAAIHEDVIVAARSDRGSVLAYRYAFAVGDTALVRKYRALIEPAVPITPTALLSGTYDTFGQLEQPYTVQLAVAPDGLAYVGVRYPEPADDTALTLHAQLFGEQLIGDTYLTDLLVTRVAADGTRLGTSVVSTPVPDELYGLRAFAGAAYVLGRSEHESDQGSGHQALLARVEADTGAVDVRELDVDRGDVAFDVLELTAGELLLVGASGYWQNPRGASISEECASFARVLHPDGSSTALALPSGPRHSEARTLLALEPGRVALAGMLDGPGTHSADADRALLSARGFLVELKRP